MAFSLKNLGSAITGAITKRIDAKLHEAGRAAVARAQALAPARTGRLRAGIGYRVENRTLTLYDDVSYAIFREFGTRNSAATPFLRPALAEVGRIFGANFELSFPNAPAYHRPVYAHRGGYVLPGHLSGKQRRHIAENLLPVSRRLHEHPNVRRARLRVGHGNG